MGQGGGIYYDTFDHHYYSLLTSKVFWVNAHFPSQIFVKGVMSLNRPFTNQTEQQNIMPIWFLFLATCFLTHLLCS